MKTHQYSLSSKLIKLVIQKPHQNSWKLMKTNSWILTECGMTLWLLEFCGRMQTRKRSSDVNIFRNIFYVHCIHLDNVYKRVFPFAFPHNSRISSQFKKPAGWLKSYAEVDRQGKPCTCVRVWIFYYGYVTIITLQYFTTHDITAFFLTN